MPKPKKESKPLPEIKQAAYSEMFQYLFVLFKERSKILVNKLVPKEKSFLKDPPAVINCILLSHDEKLLYSGSTEIVVWDTELLEEKQRLSKVKSPALFLTLG